MLEGRRDVPSLNLHKFTESLGKSHFSHFGFINVMVIYICLTVIFLSSLAGNLAMVDY